MTATGDVGARQAGGGPGGAGAGRGEGRGEPATRQRRWAALLATWSASRLVSAGLVVAIAVVDAFPWHHARFLTRGLLDEPCHVVTALVVLGAITRWRGRPPNAAFVWAMLVASVAVDVDHLPHAFGSAVLTAGTPRPHTHALWLVALLAAAAAGFRAGGRGRGTRAARWAAIFAGAAWGVAAHFFRDIFTGPISLWWPASNAAAQLPYAWYMVALTLLALLPLRARAAPGRPLSRPGARQ